MLGDGSDCASALVFLLFLDRFDGDVFSFLPVNSAPTGQESHQHTLHEEGRPQVHVTSSHDSTRQPDGSQTHARGSPAGGDTDGLPAPKGTSTPPQAEACVCQPRPCSVFSVNNPDRGWAQAPPEPVACCPGQNPRHPRVHLVTTQTQFSRQLSGTSWRKEAGDPRQHRRPHATQQLPVRGVVGGAQLLSGPWTTLDHRFNPDSTWTELALEAPESQASSPPGSGPL